MGSDRTAAEVFRLLSDDIRLDILRAVARGQHDNLETGVANLSFSDIYEQVDVDNTSKLSYHLGELTGTFLRKHESGYAFTHAGEQMVRFILAENYRPPGAVGGIETAGRCLHCGEPALRAAVEDQYFVIRCAECSHPALSYRVTPAQVRSRQGSELIDAIAWDQAGDFLKVRQGVCPDCTGRMETDVFSTDDVAMHGSIPVAFGTVSECEECLRFLSLPLPLTVAYHPASVAFHWEHGINVIGTGLWEFHDYLYDDRWTSERVDTDPDTYLVEFNHDTASLRLYLDGEATVTRTERVRRPGR
ncbi:MULTISPECIES: ArsR/SmtB family transcription factor [Salinibaculum]|uniref:ArsR/SmtB family transcription factor n=1 Tax=Salinibaculum TaxID=2732368 RepID=UPI0030D0D4A0